MRPIASITAGLLAVASLCAAQETPARILKKIEQHIQGRGAVRIEFSETYQWKLIGEEHTTAGTLLLKGHDRFRVETPDQVIVSDGKSIWTFSRPSNRVVIDVFRNNDNTLLPRKVFLEYTKEYRAVLKGEQSVEGTPCFLVLFTDDTGEKMFPSVRVWVDKEVFIPKKIEQTDLSGNVTVFTLSSFVTDVETDNTDFTFTVPEGADVIDLRTL